MHELAITQSIVDQVDEKLNGAAVATVHLEIGKLSGVVADSVRFCFDVVSSGTCLEGALLDIVEPEGRAHCRACGSDLRLADLILLCPCGSADVQIVSGDELRIKAVEVR